MPTLDDLKENMYSLTQALSGESEWTHLHKNKKLYTWWDSLPDIEREQLRYRYEQYITHNSINSGGLFKWAEEFGYANTR